MIGYSRAFNELYGPKPIEGKSKMNERIKELAVQADGVFIHKLMTGAKQYTFLEKDLEKFAELIVRECMDVASPSYMSTPEQGVYYVEQAINRIAEHFGVE